MPSQLTKSACRMGASIVLWGRGRRDRISWKIVEKAITIIACDQLFGLANKNAKTNLPQTTLSLKLAN